MLNTMLNITYALSHLSFTSDVDIIVTLILYK